MRFRAQSKSRARPSVTTSAKISDVKSSSGLGLVLEWSSLLVAAVTVCILPWLLGGAIPKARLVLQVGTIAAAVLTLLARLVSRRSFALPPLGTWLLLGMAAIGIVQLQPWMPSAISLMNHAVHPEFRNHLPLAISVAATNQATKRIPADSHSCRFAFCGACTDSPSYGSMDRCRGLAVCGGGFAESSESADVDARSNVFERQSADDTFAAAVVQSGKSRAERTVDHQ